MNKITQEIAFNMLKESMLLWSSSQLPLSRKRMDLVVEKIVADNWTRNEAYKFINIYVSEQFEKIGDLDVNSEAYEYLEDIETGITGYCDQTGFIKFIGEPEGKEQLIEYVRGNTWKAL